MAPALVFYYDIACPYAYMASRRIEAIAATSNAVITWRPVLLGGIYKAVNAPQGKDGSASDVWGPQKRSVEAHDLQRSLRRFNIPFSWHPSHPVRSVHAMRLLCATPEAQRPALSHALYRAYWVDNDDISSPTVLLKIAHANGVQVNASVFDAEAPKEQLRVNTDEVVERGAPGVPAFWVNDQLIWGSDRLHFVDRALGNPKAAQPRIALPPPGGVTQRRRLTVYHDFSSPWSYIGSTQVERVAREAGPGVQVEVVPILLGALFKQIGTPNVPMMVFSEQKRQYMGKDMQEWLAWWQIELNWPAKFPIRSVLPLRAAIVQPAVWHHIFRLTDKAAWVDNIDVADPAELAAVLTAAGFDGKAILAAADSDQAKNTLKANTDRAMAAGVCGVPSYQVDDGEVVWGQDRLDVVSDILCGWSPDADSVPVAKL